MKEFVEGNKTTDDKAMLIGLAFENYEGDYFAAEPHELKLEAFKIKTSIEQIILGLQSCRK